MSSHRCPGRSGLVWTVFGLTRSPAANAQGGELSPPKGDVKSGKKKSGSHATQKNQKKSELQFRGDDRLRARS